MKQPAEGNILDAAGAGDASRVQRLLQESPALVNQTDQVGRTALHLAALGQYWPQPGHLESARLLLQHGAAVDALGGEDPLGRAAPLILAVISSYRNVPMVELLLSSGADPNAKSSAGATPLLMAAYNGHREICDVLIKAGAELDLHSAAALGMAQHLRQILRQDPELTEERDPYLRATPLYWAALRDQKMAAQILVSYEAKLATENREGNTAVHAAAAASALRTLEYLIEEGADVNARNHELQTPLHWAIEEWWTEGTEVVKLLIAHGADVNAMDARKITPLAKATAASKTHLVDLLRKHRAR